LAKKVARGPQIAILRKQLEAVGVELEIAQRRVLALEALVDGGSAVDESAAEVTRPSVLFNALPKSASSYCFEVLRRIGGLHDLGISVGLFPYDRIAWQRYVGFATRGGYIAHHHLDASAVNLWLLRARPVRLVVHVRDPRQALLSWLHHLNRNATESGEVLPLTTASPPPGWFRLAESDQIDWLIDHHLPLFVDWIQKWVAAAESGDIEVCFTTFEDMVAEPKAFFLRLAQHCALEEAPLSDCLPDPRRERVFLFRRGLIDEWKEVYSREQTQRVARLVPPALLRRFSWDQA
jgi:hypothetical protein